MDKETLTKQYLKRNEWLIPIAQKERGEKNIYSYVWDEYLSGEPQRPFKYLIIHKENGRTVSRDSEFIKAEIEDYDKNGNKKELWDAYKNVKYEGQLRLYKYLMKKLGRPIKKYKPYKNTEIGKSIPILNFC